MQLTPAMPVTSGAMVVSDATHGWERHHFALRRLHSLTGIVPVGVFLIEHLLTNFSVVIGGPVRYQKDVAALQSIPWLVLVEWVFIFVPLAFHAGYGLFITLTGKSNVLTYRYGGNARYTLQRITAILVGVFVVVHLAKFRFNYLLPGGMHFAAGDAYAVVVAKLADGWVGAFYLVGVSAAVFHFANGLWTASITWGLTLGPRSQTRAGYIYALVGVALAVMGLASLAWFHYGITR